MVNISPICAFQDNYIWLLENNKHAVVIDPGQAAPVEQVLAERGLILTDILITHHHYDHTGGVQALVENWPQAKVYAPADEPLPCSTAVALNDGDTLTLSELGLSFTVMKVPGHTLGHIAFYTVNETEPAHPPLLFCGDTLFSGGCGRLFEGTPQQMYDSLQRFSTLPDATQVYCTHEYTQANLAFGYAVEPSNKALQKHIQTVAKCRQQGIATLPSTIGLEKAINVFLRSDLTNVKASVQAHAGDPLPENIQVFAALRRWKDDF